jgi:hypothetical protein
LSMAGRKPPRRAGEWSGASSATCSHKMGDGEDERDLSSTRTQPSLVAAGHDTRR